MIDINLIRNDKTRDAVKKSELTRYKDDSVIDKIYELDKQRIKIRYEIDQCNKKKNELKKQVSELYKKNGKQGKDLSQEIVQCLKIKDDECAILEQDVSEIEKQIMILMKKVGNIVDERVIVSKNEEDNKILRSYKSERVINGMKSYTELMSKYTHSSSGSEVVGHRGYYLSGGMAHLALALSMYSIDFLSQKGYTLVQAPTMMRKSVMAKTSQLSDFDDQLYKVEDDMYLIATSEQPLSALHMNERLTENDLPKLYCGQSLCFRKEAGAHGKDNSGIFRVHQFEKIEQFVICKPEESPDYHEKMISISEEFYKSLDISYQVVSIVSGELNDAAAIKYDLEALFPNSDKYRELVSCSNCTDYQSRELEIRYGILKKDNKKVYAHMLNCTLCAVQRTLCCIVENYQDGDTIVVPEVLRKYTGFSILEI